MPKSRCLLLLPSYLPDLGDWLVVREVKSGHQRHTQASEGCVCGCLTYKKLEDYEKQKFKNMLREITEDMTLKSRGEGKINNMVKQEIETITQYLIQLQFSLGLFSH